MVKLIRQEMTGRAIWAEYLCALPTQPVIYYRQDSALNVL